ncbi:uncharacterized protein PAF06_004280 [Gastrophryne carolinensis]
MSSGSFFIAIRDLLPVSQTAATSDRVYRGSLLTLAGAPPSHLANRKDNNSSALWLKIHESQKVVAVNPESVHEIAPVMWSVLLAVTDTEERLAFYQDPQRLKEVTQLKPGDYVRVQVISSSGRKERGVLRYRGPVNGNQEILYGVQLLGSAEGKGFTDGSFRGHRYFDCAENCGVFVPGSRLEQDWGESPYWKQGKIDGKASVDKEDCLQRNRNSQRTVTFLSRGVGQQSQPGPIEKEELRNIDEKSTGLPRGSMKDKEVPRAGEKDRDLPRVVENNRGMSRAGEKDRDICRAGERSRDESRTAEKDRESTRASERERNTHRGGKKDRDLSRDAEKESDVPRHGEKDRDLSRAAERDHNVPRGGEKDRGISRAAEKDRDVPRGGEKDRDLSRAERDHNVHRGGEKVKDIARGSQRDRNVLRGGEKDRDLSRAAERDQNVPRGDEKDRDISRTDEKNHNVPKGVEKDRDLSKASERDCNVPRACEKDRDISRPGDRSRDALRAGEKDRDISRAVERSRDALRAGEKGRDISRATERSGDVCRVAEKDQEFPKTGENDNSQYFATVLLDFSSCLSSVLALFEDQARLVPMVFSLPKPHKLLDSYRLKNLDTQQLLGFEVSVVCLSCVSEEERNRNRYPEENALQAEDEPQPLNNPLEVNEQEAPNHLPKDHHPPSSLYCPPGNGSLLFEPEPVSHGLELNSMVEVNDPPIYGVIRWIGHTNDSPEPIAGLEMEEALPSAYTDGVYRGFRYFTCGPNKALFVKLRNCRPDSRFYLLHGSANPMEGYNSVVLQDYTSKRVEENTPPLTEKEASECLLGWRRGIQGHCNSCYLDATLFCMFACSSVLDTMLLRPPDKNDSDSYINTRDLLRTEIVNPLRRDGYVCATKVMALRKILEAAGQSTGFTNEEKDPEEFLNRLFQVLRVEPLFYIRTPNKKPQGCIFYQIFMEKRQSVNVPSVQQLLEWSMVTGDLKFTEVPSCLIIQMPRDGKNKMFPTILPTLQLDITDLLEDAPRLCSICQSLAVVECPDCYDDTAITPGQIKQYCTICSRQVHLHRQRCGHKPRELKVPENVRGQAMLQRQHLQLYAVLCIETSHYVAFIRIHSEERPLWAFFDSMADREGGRNGFNIPKVVTCPEVTEYLEMSPEKLQQEDPKSMPTYAHRLFCDAYMCLYYSPDLSLYK